MDERQASVEVTPEMIEAAMAVYDCWEQNHISDGQGGAAEYAIEELAEAMYRAMEAAKGPIYGEMKEALQRHSTPAPPTL